MRKLLVTLALMVGVTLAAFAPASADTVSWPPPGTTPSVSWTWTCAGGLVVHADNQPYLTDFLTTVDGVTESSGTIGAANYTGTFPNPTSDPTVAHTGELILTPESTGVPMVTHLSIGVCVTPCHGGHGDHHDGKGHHHGEDGDRRHHR